MDPHLNIKGGSTDINPSTEKHVFLQQDVTNLTRFSDKMRYPIKRGESKETVALKGSYNKPFLLWAKEQQLIFSPNRGKRRCLCESYSFQSSVVKITSKLATYIIYIDGMWVVVNEEDTHITFADTFHFIDKNSQSSKLLKTHANLHRPGTHPFPDITQAAFQHHKKTRNASVDRFHINHSGIYYLKGHCAYCSKGITRNPFS